MSMQGSIHTWSDGIGYGAFIPTDRAYFNVRTPRASGRRPSSEQLREYRRQNVTGGIDTHRSNISFGKTTESVRGGLEGDPRAREATKCLTSGEVGSFCWPAERAREGDVETILASSSVAPSHDSAVESSLSAPGGRGSKNAQPPMMLSARSVKQHEDAAEAMVVSTAERRRQEQQEQQEQQQPRGEATKPLSCGGHKSARSNHGGSSTQRSDSTHLASSSSSTGSYNSSGLSTFRSSVSSSGEVRSRGKRSSRSSSSGSSGRRTRRPTSYDATIRDATTLTNNDPAQRQQLSHRSASSSARENRLRPPALLLGHRTLPPPSSSARPGTHHPPRPRALDPVFDRHHKYDLIAEEQAAKGGEVTGRYGEIHGSSVMAANLLTSELSTPWSHVLRGQKW